MKSTDENTRSNIILAKQRGEKREAIANWLNISKSTVDKIWRRFKETGSYKATPCTGRKSIISKEQDKEIMAITDRVPSITLEEIIEELSLPLSVSGLWRKLKRMGISYKKTQTTPKQKIVQIYKKNAKNGNK